MSVKLDIEFVAVCNTFTPKTNYTARNPLFTLTIICWKAGTVMRIFQKLATLSAQTHVVSSSCRIPAVADQNNSCSSGCPCMLVHLVVHAYLFIELSVHSRMLIWLSTHAFLSWSSSCPCIYGWPSGYLIHVCIYAVAIWLKVLIRGGVHRFRLTTWRSSWRQS